jgi:hypothetical protein
MFHPTTAWALAAERLGLVLYEPLGPFERGASFSRLKRAMGNPAGASPRQLPWMYGKWRPAGRERGVEVLVVTHHVPSGVDTIFFTHTIARIDPPFRLGIDLRRRGQPGTLAMLHVTGDPAFDHAYALEGVDTKRAAAVFRRTDDLLDRLIDLQRWDVHVTDSTVDVFTHERVFDPDELRRRLEDAATAAALLAAREREPDPRVATWQAFAESEGLALDRDRMSMTGDVAGLRVRIGLEGEPCMLFTVVIADLPKLLGVGLRLGRHGPLDVLADLLAPQDIRVGDRVFDEIFAIRGEPNGVMTLFAQPELRLAIHELALGAKDVAMDDARLYVRYPLPVDALGGITHRLRIIAGALAATRPSGGPYR